MSFEIEKWEKKKKIETEREWIFQYVCHSVSYDSVLYYLIFGGDSLFSQYNLVYDAEHINTHTHTTLELVRNFRNFTWHTDTDTMLLTPYKQS